MLFAFLISFLLIYFYPIFKNPVHSGLEMKNSVTINSLKITIFRDTIALAKCRITNCPSLC